MLCERELVQCVVTESGRESVHFLEREAVCVSARSRAKKKYCVCVFCARIESGHMETRRQTVFFSVVMDYQRPVLK